MKKHQQLFILTLAFLLAVSLAENVDDLNGFKDCQKRFGFSKKLEKSLNAEDDSNNKKFLHQASQSVIQKELSVFYKCLSELSTCEELILASEEGSTQKKQIPIQECLQKCYNPNDFQTKFMKDLTEFSVNCAKSTLNIQVSFENQDNELRRFKSRIPWEIVSFGAILSSLFVAWVNLKQIRIKFQAKKQGQQDNQGKSIYELNPDFIAHKAFQTQIVQAKNMNNNTKQSSKDEESLQDYQKEITTSDSLKENTETQKIAKQNNCQANLKESNWENKNNEQKGLLCGQDENGHSDYEDEFAGNEDPFDLHEELSATEEDQQQLRQIENKKQAAHHHEATHSRDGNQEEDEDNYEDTNNLEGDDDQFEDEIDEEEDEENEEVEADMEEDEQYDLICNIKYCNKTKKISIPMQAGFIREIMNKAQIDTSLVKHANTTEAAQDELLICLGQTLKDKLQTVWKNKKSEEIVRQLFLNICFKIFLTQLQGFIQMSMERKGCKTSLEQYLEEDERAKEAKQMKNQKKKLKQKAKKQEKRQEELRKQEEEQLLKKQEEEKKAKLKQEAKEQKKLLEEEQQRQKILLQQAQLNNKQLESKSNINKNAANGKKKKKNAKVVAQEENLSSPVNPQLLLKPQEENEDFGESNSCHQTAKKQSDGSSSTADCLSHTHTHQILGEQDTKNELSEFIPVKIFPNSKKSNSVDIAMKLDGTKVYQKRTKSHQQQLQQQQHKQNCLENNQNNNSNNGKSTNKGMKGNSDNQQQKINIEETASEYEKNLLKKMGWKEEESRLGVSEIHEKEIQEYCKNKTKFDRERACHRRNLQQRFQCLLRSHSHIRAK